MQGLGGDRGEHIRSHIGGALSEMDQQISGMRSVPGKLRQQREVLSRGMEAASDIGPTGMDASVARIKEAAMLPVRAQRKVTQRGGAEMQSPLAGKYYPERHNVGKEIGEQTFGKGSEGAFRSMLATPTLSARTPPQVEIAGGAGLAAVMRDSSEIGINLGHHSARYLNQELRGSRGSPEIPEGPHSLAQLAATHPQAAALLLQHGATQSGLVVPKANAEKMSAGKQARDLALGTDAKVSIPRGLEEPTAAFISSLGNTGFPKGGRAMARFLGDPSDYGRGEFHKIPSYTWNIHQAGSDVMQQGTHHFLGALTHGNDWFAAHPDAEHHIRRAMDHPAWHDPTSTQDVWAGRLASGLHPHVAMALGEATNPENIMGFNGLKGLRKAPGHALGKASDLGYLYQEEAHRRAGQALSVRLPGGGKAHAPGSVVQSLAWYGVQAQAFPEQVRGGSRAQRTLTPT